MSALQIIEGNLIKLAKQGKFDIIVHGCNCFNTMGAGIAKSIKDEFPEAWNVDQSTVRGEKSKLGTFSIAVTPSVIVVNAYTQYATSRGDDVFEYAKFEEVLASLYEKYKGAHFGLPLIGCGLAKGDESKILALIESFAIRVRGTGGQVTLVKFKDGV